MAKNRRTQQSEDNGERRDPETRSEEATVEAPAEDRAPAEEPVDADKLDRITEDHEAEVVRRMGLDTSYFGAKAAEALCEYGAHGDLASLDRAVRFIQRERGRIVVAE